MKFKVLSVLLFIFLAMFSNEMLAQCPMCRMAAESNLEHGGSMGKGLNKGILYMFMMPYLIVFTLGFIWYKNKRILIDDENQYGESSEDFELPE